MVELVAVVCLDHQGWGVGFGFEFGLLAGIQADDLVVESADEQAGKPCEFAAAVAAVAAVAFVLVAEKPSIGQRLGISVLYFNTH